MATGGYETKSIPSPWTRCAEVAIEVIDGVNRDARCDVAASELTVGTSAENDLVLTDPHVSAHHLWLRAGEGGVLVRDLGSATGTFLGGVRIREAIVPLGARLRIGDTVLRLVDRGLHAGAAPTGQMAVPGMVGVSAAMFQVCRAVQRLAQSDVSVLVQGETGTGKELVSRALHDLGPRAGRPYVIVDVGALAPTLVASQLFGHERGAFTGAEGRHIGAFEQANGGSILLDEIGELPASVQPALLGVLERRTFRRLGGKEEIRVDVRVIAATHRDLRAEVRRGTFRDDLYFRMAAARIHIPPLRERPEDIAPLVEHFARQIAGEEGVAAAAPLLATLGFQPWPGNVRQLRNVVEGALMAGTGMLDSAALADSARAEVVLPYRTA